MTLIRIGDASVEYLQQAAEANKDFCVDCKIFDNGN